MKLTYTKTLKEVEDLRRNPKYTKVKELEI